MFKARVDFGQTRTKRYTGIKQLLGKAIKLQLEIGQRFIAGCRLLQLIIDGFGLLLEIVDNRLLLLHHA
ncbi:hypothetical protein D9M68_858120 [compost metagenome]